MTCAPYEFQNLVSGNSASSKKKTTLKRWSEKRCTKCRNRATSPAERMCRCSAAQTRQSRSQYDCSAGVQRFQSAVLPQWPLSTSSRPKSVHNTADEAYRLRRTPVRQHDASRVPPHHIPASHIAELTHPAAHTGQLQPKDGYQERLVIRLSPLATNGYAVSNERCSKAMAIAG